MGDRREELAEAATDHVLEHGLIGLSLRPLAAALGTSDRMLLYHFGTKDDLLATVMRTSNDRSVTYLRGLPPSADPRRAVLDIWAALNQPALARCQRTYVEMAALGVLGREPYATVVSEANDRWLDAVTDHLTAAGVPPGAGRRAATLVDATFLGLQLDQPLDGEQTTRHSVEDLADVVAELWGRDRT